MPSEAELKEAANRSPVLLPWWVTILYGDFGTRKTTTACSMVNKRGLLISADNSWKVLLNERHRGVYEKLHIVAYDSLKQLDYLDFNSYDTIIWDPISISVDGWLDMLHDHAKWSGNQRETITSDLPELKGKQNLGFIDYRFTRDSFRPVLNRLFKETQAHLIFTSHMRVPVPGMGKNQQKRPAIPEATFSILGIQADLIAMCSGEGTKYTADVTNSLTQLGKSRFETIQGKMSLDEFVSKYKEKVFK